jgi:hypothetical protein
MPPELTPTENADVDKVHDTLLGNAALSDLLYWTLAEAVLLTVGVDELTPAQLASLLRHLAHDASLHAGGFR